MASIMTESDSTPIRDGGSPAEEVEREQKNWGKKRVFLFHKILILHTNASLLSFYTFPFLYNFTITAVNYVLANYK